MSTRQIVVFVLAVVAFIVLRDCWNHETCVIDHPELNFEEVMGVCP